MYSDEEYKTYLKVKKEFLRNDIKERYEAMSSSNPTKEQLDLLCDKVEKTLKNNDSYWESYWLSIEYNIKDEIRG